jgi:uncharacterized protein YdhG (YjbR/CyaY superfamily)
MRKYADVNEFMQAIDNEQREQVALLRSTIVATHPELTEHIKWNSPSYMLGETDRITFSVHPKYPVTIILHMGASQPEKKDQAPVMNDSAKLIEWKSNIRGSIAFTDLDDIRAKKTQLEDIIDAWLKI